jgi:protein TonB
VVLALAIEALIALLFLYLTPLIPKKKEPAKLVVFGIQDAGDSAESKADTKQQKARPKGGSAASVKQPLPVPTPPPVPPPITPPKNNFIRLSRSEMAAGNIAQGQAPAGTGPAAATSDGTGDWAAGDSEVVGKGPHGEPLYAAEWYREPTDAQLSPYIPERVRGRGGWGVIACRTVANYRVEDCQELDDSQRGSGYAGAVRQAAWQFRVRPPRVGGKPLLGSWVKILIRYTVREVQGDSARPGAQSDSEKPDDQ